MIVTPEELEMLCAAAKERAEQIARRKTAVDAAQRALWKRIDVIRQIALPVPEGAAFWAGSPAAARNGVPRAMVASVRTVELRAAILPAARESREAVAAAKPVVVSTR
jgi:hypothetical protein